MVTDVVGEEIGVVDVVDVVVGTDDTAFVCDSRLPKIQNIVKLKSLCSCMFSFDVWVGILTNFKNAEEKTIRKVANG